MKIWTMAACGAALLATAACGGGGATAADQSGAATAGARPYTLSGTEVWTVPDPASGRAYDVFVSLPASYAQTPGRRYPVLYVTDADYAFPVIRSIARRVRDDGKALEDFIIVGLSYAAGDDPMTSRRRDYTPTPNGPRRNAREVHGGAEAYRVYLRDEVLPFVAGRYRTNEARRILLGHSYGALLGAHVLFTQPDLFSGYILGSPSLWYDRRHMLQVEAAYAAAHRDLRANVFLYIGAYEALRPGDRRYNQETDMVADMTLFEQRLRGRGYPGLTIAASVVPEEDHLTVAPSGFTRGLKALLPARAGP